MKVSINSLNKIISEYLITEIIPKTPGSITKFGLALSASYLSNNAVSLIGEYLPMLKAVNAVDEQNYIDIEQAKEHLTKAMQTCGGKLNIGGYLADAEDINLLCNIARKYGE